MRKKAEEKRKVRCLVCKKNIRKKCANYYQGICFAVKVFDEISQNGFNGNKYSSSENCDFFIDREKMQHKRAQLEWDLFFAEMMGKDGEVRKIKRGLERLTVEVHWAETLYKHIENIPKLEKNGNLDLFTVKTARCPSA